MAESKRFFEETMEEKLKRSEKLKAQYRSRTRAQKFQLSRSKSRGLKRWYSTMSEAEKCRLRENQVKGMLAAREDPLKRQKRINKRYDRLKSGFVVHQHVVCDATSREVLVWTRGYEIRTISFLVGVFGKSTLYCGMRLTNDVYFVKSDNRGIYIRGNQLGICRSLKTPSIRFEEDGLILRHDLDHHLELEGPNQRSAFVDGLVKHFEVDDGYFQAVMEGKTRVAIETKSFKMASIHKGEEWLERMLANATAALASCPDMAYFVFCWTLSTLTLYHINQSLHQVGKTIPFPDSAKDNEQLFKYHREGFEGTGVEAPSVFTKMTEIRSKKPLSSQHVDSVAADKLHITIRKKENHNYG